MSASTTEHDGPHAAATVDVRNRSVRRALIVAGVIVTAFVGTIVGLIVITILVGLADGH